MGEEGDLRAGQHAIRSRSHTPPPRWADAYGDEVVEGRRVVIRPGSSQFMRCGEDEFPDRRGAGIIHAADGRKNEEGQRAGQQRG